MKVFVGSTRKDLNDDCRADVLETLELASAERVVMETWPAEHDAAVKVCLEKLALSTHYIGLFGYYLGWVPEGWPVSITQAEYELATRTVKQKLVLVPEEGTAFADELRRRADVLQEGAAAAHQSSFLSNLVGVAEPFRSRNDLIGRVWRRVTAWQQPVARPGATPCALCPSDQELIELGRAEQARVFRDALPRLGTRGVPRARAVLIQGPENAGFTHMRDRLVAEVRKSSFQQRIPRLFVVNCDTGWRRNDLGGLLAALSQAFVTSSQARTLSELVVHLAALAEQREEGDIILAVDDVQQYDGGLDALAAEFWQPLVASLPADAPRRLVCLISHTDGKPPASGPAYVDPSAAALAPPESVVVLPTLDQFTAEEILAFLHSWPRVPFGDEQRLERIADSLAARCLSPERVFQILRQAAVWLPEDS